LTSIKDGSDPVSDDVHDGWESPARGEPMSATKTTDELASDRASILTELVDVAEGAIVSRVLASSGGGNVTLFAFDRGQGLSEHTAPFDALVQVVDGRLDLKIGGVEVTVGMGEIVRMPANVPHGLHAPEPARMLLTMLREPNPED
jgi:quercetin dioxygenase-like cupin family protein